MNEVSVLGQLELLLWKNFMVQRNEAVVCQLISELLLTFLSCGLLLVLRLYITPKNIPATLFESTDLENLSIFEKLPDLPKVLAYSPQNALLDKIMDETIKSIKLESFKGFQNPEDVEQALEFTNFTAVVEFVDDYSRLEEYPRQFAITLRFPSILRTLGNGKMNIWQTEYLYPYNPTPGPRNAKASSTDGQPIGYFDEGFLQLQNALTLSFIKLAGKQSELPKISMQRFPYPEYVEDKVMQFIRGFLPIILIISSMGAVFSVTHHISLEKEKHLKEVMKIMGVPNWIHWTAWFIRSLLISSITCIILTILLKIRLNNGLAVFIHSDAMVILLFFSLYTIAVICFSFMMAVFFNRAITASVITVIIFFLIYIPIYTVMPNYDSLNLFEKLMLCLNLNLAMPFGVRILANWEVSQEGVHWLNIFKAVNDGDNLSLGLVLVMLFVSSCLYMMICLYFEQLFPGKVGIPARWHFFLSSDCCCKKERGSEFLERPLKTIIPADPAIFEESPKNAQVGVEIRALEKQFGDKWAVKNLSLNLYENEITVLLGHNGAGKTTTISMLTGILPPTSGTALIYGFDIRSSFEGVRPSIGFCPQYNILFDYMSVVHHLTFFAKLKGLKGGKLDAEVEKYLKKAQLKQSANVLASKLSGGRKRLLSLCCALCGNTKIVFCDEPSSGMDQKVRRQLWDILQSEKIGKTVLLTTHLMDEAEILGDRIGIMCNGMLQCYGTSFFLKEQFGAEYRLTCTKAKQCNVENVTQFLKKYIPRLQPYSEIGPNLTYALPDSFSSKFGLILEDLEVNIESLGLVEFGVKVTSLEDVFLMVCAENFDSHGYLMEREKSNRRTLGGQEKNSNNKMKPQGQNDVSSVGRTHDKPRGNKLRKQRGTLDFKKLKENNDITVEESLVGLERNVDADQNQIKNKKRQDETLVNKILLKEEMSPRPGTLKSNESTIDVREGVAFRTNDNHHDGSNGPLRGNKSFFNLNEIESQNINKTEGLRLIYNSWRAMMYKKMILARRNLFIVLVLNLVAIIFAVIALMNASVSNLIRQPPLTYSLQQYSKAISLLEVVPSITSQQNEYKFADQYLRRVEANAANYIFETSGSYNIEAYILKLEKKENVRLIREYLVGATIKENEIIAWYNNQPFHTTPLALNLVHNAMAKHFIGSDCEITLTNHPLPYKFKSRETSFWFYLQEDLKVIFIVSFCMAFVTAYYAVFPIKERTSEARLLQFVSGVRSSTFWLSHFIWDFFMLSLTAVLIIVIFGIFNVPAYWSFEALFQYYLLLQLFCFSTLPLTYVLAECFKEPMDAYVVFSITYVFLGIFLLAFMDVVNNIIYWKLFRNWTYAFIFVPHFSLIFGWLMLDVNTKTNMHCKEESLQRIAEEMKCKLFPDCCKPLKFIECHGNCIYYFGMLVTGVVLLLYLIIRDQNPHFKSCKTENICNQETTQAIDDDVRDEEKRIMRMTKEEIGEQHLVLDRVQKRYKDFYALKGLSVSIKSQECLGLLGSNGAGKTTLIKMLTGYERISSGDAFVLGTSVRKNLAAIYKGIGYCPQTDALLDELTGREMLFIFCLIRGVPKDQIKDYSEDLAFVFGFMKLIDKPTKAYSGGDKRKLSIALAVIGEPTVLLLDEPTFGMDPVTQRMIWNIIGQFRDSGKSIVLTTHSMVEVEALCTKVAIMVDGRFRCIGSIQHLKNKFSKGLVLRIQIERNEVAYKRQSTSKSIQRKDLTLEDKIFNIKMAIMGQYPTAKIETKYQGMLIIHVTLPNIRWSELFTWLEANLLKLQIEDFSINETTLEEVFLDFSEHDS